MAEVVFQMTIRLHSSEARAMFDSPEKVREAVAIGLETSAEEASRAIHEEVDFALEIERIQSETEAEPKPIRARDYLSSKRPKSRAKAS